jgi:diacylglycerol kinase family enzyme
VEGRLSDVARPAPGVLVNARARRARRDPALVERLQRLLPAGHVRATASADEIGPALDELRRRGVDTLVVVGGDGTVGGTLTPLLARWPAEALPAVLLAPGGTMNTIASSLGARGQPERLLRRLLANGAPRVETRRPLVRVRTSDGETRDGMIFANGVAERWLRLYYRDTGQGVPGAVFGVAKVLGSASVGGPLARRLFEPAGVVVEVDGERLELERYTVMAASSVQHVGLGFRPFYSAGREPGRFHFTITEAGAARLSRELPALRLGRAARSACLRHYAARLVSLRFSEAQPWSIDADFYPPTRALELSATPQLRFVVP